MQISVGPIVARRGEVVRDYLEVGYRRDSNPIRIPVTVISGKSDGPTVWLQGTVHGNERTGAATVVQIIREINPEKLSGTLICVPVVNTIAYEVDVRSAPIDNADMNRVVPDDPGDRTAMYSGRVAKKLLAIILNAADYIVDLHAGSHREASYYVVYRELDNGASRRSREIAEQMGAPVIWKSSEKVLDQALFTLATGKGIPAVMIEIGGGRMSSYIDVVKEGVLNALIVLKMIPGSVKIPNRRLIVGGWHNVFAERGGGILIPHKEPGAIVDKGTVLGEIVNLHGEVVDILVSPSDHCFIRWMAKSYSPLATGERAFGLLRIEKEQDLTN